MGFVDISVAVQGEDTGKAGIVMYIARPIGEVFFAVVTIRKRSPRIVKGLSIRRLYMI